MQPAFQNMSKEEVMTALAEFASANPIEFAEAMVAAGKSEDLQYGVYKIGDSVFIRAIPFHYIGKIESIDGEKLGLWPCRFVRNTGHWTQALENGQVEDREFPKGTGPVYVTRATIHNVFHWPHKV